MNNLYEIILAEDNTALTVDVNADATNDAIYVNDEYNKSYL